MCMQGWSEEWDIWQSLGMLPHLHVVYSPTPGAGMLWAIPTPFDDSGNPDKRLYTASYTP